MSIEDQDRDRKIYKDSPWELINTRLTTVESAWYQTRSLKVDGSYIAWSM